MQIFSNQTKKLVELAKNPLQALEQLNRELDRHCTSDDQRLFLLDWIVNYSEELETEVDMEQVHELLAIEYNSLEALIKPKPKPKIEITTEDLRERMKVIMSNELDQLPEILASLEPKERLMILTKFMPFVFPKVENVHHKTGENGAMNFSSLL